MGVTSARQSRLSRRGGQLTLEHVAASSRIALVSRSLAMMARRSRIKRGTVVSLAAASRRKAVTMPRSTSIWQNSCFCWDIGTTMVFEGRDIR